MTKNLILVVSLSLLLTHLEFITEAEAESITSRAGCAEQLLTGTPTGRDLIECLIELEELLQTQRPELPAGTVIAYAGQGAPTSECPDRWTRFNEANGKFIIGAGEGTNSTYRNLNDTGGEETHILSLEEMPPHFHGIGDIPSKLAAAKGNASVDIPSAAQVRVSNGWYGVHVTNTGTENSGGGQPHNNMPPYIALYFCKKD